MQEFFASGRVADLILAVLVLEAGLLLAWQRRRGQGPGAAGILVLLLPGAALVLALRLALTGGHWIWLALALLAALLAHLLDLALRLRK